jgi:Cu(I)/Ag(I) efflux system periplasmic protein CusF
MDASGSDTAPARHTTRGVVKRLDPVAGRITLAHQPVASLNWPSMTMGFGVRDRALLNGLAEGAEVEVDFVREGKDWIITSVK